MTLLPFLKIKKILILLRLPSNSHNWPETKLKEILLVKLTQLISQSLWVGEVLSVIFRAILI